MSRSALADLGRKLRAKANEAGVDAGLISLDLADGGVVRFWPDGATFVVDAKGGVEVLERPSADVRTPATVQ